MIPNSSDSADSPLEPTCPICDGTGWVSYDVPVSHPDFGRLHPCPGEQHIDGEHVRREALGLSRDLAYLTNMTFEKFRIEERNLTDDQVNSLDTAYVLTRKYDQEPRGWLLIYGNYGVGKTHLAAAIANSRLSRGLPVLFLNVPDLLDSLRATFSPQVEETYSERFERILDVPFLILDDLGTQSTTAWAEEKLFQILNHRYVAKLPTVITTNLTLDDFDPRLSSRLSDRTLVRVVHIAGPDYRRSEFEQEHSSLNSLIHYSDKTFETFDLRTRERGLSQRQLDSLKEAFLKAQVYAETPKDWLVLLGTYGCGKTHLAAAIAHRIASLGHSVLFVVVPDLLDHLRETFSPDSKVSYDERFEEVRTTSVLVLDDLGTESATPWAREKLYQIINYRYVARRPTVITTVSLRNALDDRIRSRVLDQTRCQVVPIFAPSYNRRGLTLLDELEPEQPGEKSSAKSGSRTSISRKRR